jgi:capsular exopolysaccharide synthesis family protein
LIQQYLRIGRRWLWLLLLATLATGIVGYVVARQQSHNYSASARVIIGPGLESPDPSLEELRTAGMLMQTYGELITTRPFLESVIRNLNLSITADQLAKDISLHSDDTTRILTLRVVAGDATHAVSIANAIAELLVNLGPVNSEESEARIKDQTRNQIGYLEQEISSLEATLVQLEQDFNTATNREEKRLYGDQIALRRAQLAEASRSVIALEQSLMQSQTNQVKIIEPAVAGELVDPELELTVAMAALAGLILALAVVFVFEYLGDVIRSAEDLVGLTHMPLLGTIAKYRPLYSVGREHFVAYGMPESRTAEQYRLLASKLILSRYRAAARSGASAAAGPDGQAHAVTPALAERPLRSLLISGTHINGAGSSEIAANLAVTLAQTGHRVILVDANLHQPDMSGLFGVSNRVSLSNLLAGQQADGQLTPLTWLPTLSILSSGPIPAKSFDLLASTRMAELIRELEEQADLVVISASPLLLYADSLILASRVDGVVVVAEQGTTRRATLVEIVDSLHAFGASILGVVLDQNHGSSSTRRTRAAAPSNAATSGPIHVQSAGRVVK